MNFLKKFLLPLLFIATSHTIGNSQTFDTTFHSNKIWKIESKRDGKKFGISKTYLTYTDELKLDQCQFYIDDKLYGLDVMFNWYGNLSSFTNYRNDVPVFNKTHWWNDDKGEEYYSTIHATVRYGKSDVLEHISYPNLKEAVYFYPNKMVKSIIISDSSQKTISRKYYEFSEEGYLKIEGTYADSFFQVLDTIITYDPETYEEIVQVMIVDLPLKNGYWFYYSDKGILQEKKLYAYFEERKGRTIRY